MLLLHVLLILFAGAGIQAEIVPANASKNISWPYHTFKTAIFTPPVVKVSRKTSTEDRYLFFAPDGATAYQAAPVITDSDGDLIWNGPRGKAFGFNTQSYRGEQVIVYWNGTAFPEPIGRGHGAIHILNKHYEEIAQVTLPGNFVELESGQTFPSNIDLHEMYITEAGTTLVLGNNVTQTDLTSVGGRQDGWIVEAQVYEIDIASNEVLFVWKSLDHQNELPINASVYPLGSEGCDGTKQSKAWGYFHINSVAPYRDGYVLSSRYLSSAIALEKSGAVAWRINGIHGGDFTLGENADFRYQHHIRVTEDNGTFVVLRMHDNHNSPIDNNTVPSSGKFLEVNLETRHVTLQNSIRYFNQTGPIFPTAQGSFDTMENGNLFTGNGWIPVLEEFSPCGETIATYQFGNATERPDGGFFSGGRGTLSYRGFRHRWTGCPKTKPAIVAEHFGSAARPYGTRVYISWNGATEVKEYEIHGGIETISKITTVPRGGFETVVDIDSVQVVQVKPVFKADAPQDCAQETFSGVVFVKPATKVGLQ